MITINGQKETSFSIPLVVSNEQPVKNSDLLRKVIGQAEAGKKLRFFVDSHSASTPLPTLLFTGSQGLGKSFMAQKVADSLGRELVEINCGTLESSKDFVEEVLFKKILGGKPKTILLDEAHSLSPDITTNLLTLLNPNGSNKNILVYKNWRIEYDFRHINTIFATTDAHKMFRPLLNRCVEIYFSLYTNEELFDILAHYLQGIKITCNKNDIAYACRGRARDAFILSQHIKRYCVMNNLNVFDNKGWKDIRSIFGIHNLGLNSQEVSLLGVLAESSPISSNNLAAKMGVNINNIESEIEIRPRELGLIESCNKGRYITEQGKTYLESL